MPPRYAEPGTKRSIAARLPPRSPCFRASPHQSWRETALTSTPGQDLKRVLACRYHHIEYLLYERLRYLLVEEVAIEFTKIIRGRDHFNGCPNRSGQSFSAKPCS